MDNSGQKEDGVEIEESNENREVDSDSEDDLEWDNGEPLTENERKWIMTKDKFSRAQEMNRRRRIRLEAADTTSWDNGEPLTDKERHQIMRMSLYERVRAMNIRKNKRLARELAEEYQALFDEERIVQQNRGAQAVQLTNR